MKIQNNIIRKIVFLLIVISSSFLANAQEAKKLLNEVSNKVRGYDNIVIEFKWNLNNQKEGVNQDTRGNVTIKGDNYVLNMLGSSRIFDGENTYTISPEDEEVTISKYTGQDDKEITPSKLLTFYEKGYTSKLDIKQNIQGRNIQFVKLQPIDTEVEIKNILLGIDVQTKHIYKLIQIDTNGTRYTLTVNTFKTNQPLSKTLFTFDQAKYEEKGYYIDRLD